MDFTAVFRPTSFDDLLGQPHLCAPGAPLRPLCEKGSLGHSFFFGPPGTGKTSLARVIAKRLDLPFYEFNATSLRIDQLRSVFDRYRNALMRPLLFIDEVHRLAKNQQEVLLPVMETNQVLVIGASTENPFFSLTAAMRSRAMLFELHALDAAAMRTLLDKAASHAGITLDGDAADYLVRTSGGDARAMLKLLEYAAELDPHVTRERLESLRPAAQSRGSAEADEHYDLASALIKSVRGSDPDAAIYYLARLIEGGEPPEFIARRLVILASEDVGNANPQALTLCVSAMTAVKTIGYPEARIPLAQAVLYLCASPKSNSAYAAINAAQKAVRDGLLLDPPDTIRQFNEGYLYPHDFGGWVEQAYLREPHRFVRFTPVGYEKKMAEWLDALRTTEPGTGEGS
jgi:putative ATPase